MAESTDFEAVSRACAAGAVDACVTFAERFTDGRGVARDFAVARDRLESLCVAQAPRACAALARINVWSFFPEHARRGRVIAERECAARRSEACVVLSDARAHGLGGAIERDRVEAPLEQACGASVSEACAALSLVRASSGRPVDAREASSLCDRGLARACLARALVVGDRPASLALFERACELGEARGCSSAAALLRSIEFVGSLRADALATRGCLQLLPSAGCRAWVESSPRRFSRDTRERLYERACQLERDVRACVESVRARLRGSVGTSALSGSLAVLVSWVAPACAAGDVSACGALGALEATELPTIPRALARLRAACDGGDAFGCAQLGSLLATDTTQASEARSLWRRACEMGEVLGCRAMLRSLPQARAAREGARATILAVSQRGCTLEDSESCATAAVYAETPAQARAFEARACELGDHERCRALTTRDAQAR